MNSTAAFEPIPPQIQGRQIPHRKPLPGHQQPPSSPTFSRPVRSHDRIQPLTKIRAEDAAPTNTPPKQQRVASHTHNRTTSSTTLPPSSFSPPPSAQQHPQPPSGNTNNMYQPKYSYPSQGTRRTLSNATTSTTSTSGGRKNSVGGSTLQRTTSSRSGSSPTSYVAMMRRQKATVWSDRAQHEDPRLIAQQRAAKMRAALEVNSNPHSGRVSTSGNSSITGGMRAKIRHHGAPKAQQYNPTPNVTSGVPMRLSAREVDDDDIDDDHLLAQKFHHRSSSGRSSVGSAGRASSFYGTGQLGVVTRGSSGSNTPPQNHGVQAQAPQQQQRQRAETQDSTGAEPTPVPEDFRSADYFSPRASSKDQTPGSTSSEQENEFGKVEDLPHRVRDVKEGDTNEDLQRRGSVDERSMTMRGYGRLFVANPDLDD